MKKITLFMGLVAMQAVALQTSTPTKFTPTPMNEEIPTRFMVSIDSASMLSGGGFDAAGKGAGAGLNTNGKIGLMNLQLNLALMYSVGMGLDVGFGVHGGMQSPYSMFFGDPVYPTGLTQRYSYMFGADVMIRYLAMLSDMFYAGLQAQGGYNYTDSFPGATDAQYTTLSGGADSKTAYNSFIPVTVGVPVGVIFPELLTLYVFPAIELGQTNNVTNTTTPTTLDKGVWKSAVGIQMGVGTAIYTSIGDVVIQLTPRLANFSNKYSWGLDFNTAMQWDF